MHRLRQGGRRQTQNLAGEDQNQQNEMQMWISNPQNQNVPTRITICKRDSMARM